MRWQLSWSRMLRWNECTALPLEIGLNLPEVAVISGHKDPRMLFRYTHLRVVDLLNRL